MRRFFSVILLTLIGLILIGFPVFADDNAKINWTQGPTTVDVGKNIATLKLPENFVFTDADGAKNIMQQMGNSLSGQEVGIVAAKDESENWYILFEYDPTGYIKDDESNALNADELLASIKKGTEEHNKELAKQGLPEITVVGWDEKPHYDQTTHNLVWSVKGKDSEGESINYNTRLLGRYGVMSALLVADPQDLPRLKPVLNQILNNFSYKEGKKYSDFVPGKDEVSNLGLTALIAGGAGAAAAKTGMVAKFLLLFKKFWIIVFAPIVALYKKIKEKFSKKTGVADANTAGPQEDSIESSEGEPKINGIEQ